MHCIRLFNPFSSKYDALENFKKLTFIQKFITVITTIAISSLTFMLGATPVFRLLVGRFRKLVITNQAPTTPNEKSAKKANHEGQRIFQIEAPSRDRIISQELMNTAGYMFSEEEKWLYEELDLPLDQSESIEIRNKVTARIGQLQTQQQLPNSMDRESIRKLIKQFAIEERLLSLDSDEMQNPQVVDWLQSNLSSVLGLMKCFTELHTRTKEVLESRKQEIIELVKEETAEHPDLEQHFVESVESAFNAFVTNRVSKFLTLEPENIHQLVSYSEQRTHQRLFGLFESGEKRIMQGLAPRIRVENVLGNTHYQWYTKWKSCISASLMQGNDIGGEALGIGICDGIALRLIHQELEDQDYLLNNLDTLIKITPRDRYIQSRADFYKRVENADFSAEFLRGIGLKKPSLEDLGFHNEISIRIRDSYRTNIENLIRYCWAPERLNTGVCRLAIYFNDQPGGHALYVRNDRDSSSFRFFDANLGLLEFVSEEDLFQSLGELLQTSVYGNLKSFAFTRFELAS